VGRSLAVQDFQRTVYSRHLGLEPQAMHLALKQFLPYLGGNMYLLGETSPQPRVGLNLQGPLGRQSCYEAPVPF